MERPLKTGEPARARGEQPGREGKVRSGAAAGGEGGGRAGWRAGRGAAAAALRGRGKEREEKRSRPVVPAPAGLRRDPRGGRARRAAVLLVPGEPSAVGLPPCLGEGAAVGRRREASGVGCAQNSRVGRFPLESFLGDACS